GDMPDLRLGCTSGAEPRGAGIGPQWPMHRRRGAVELESATRGDTDWRQDPDSEAVRSWARGRGARVSLRLRADGSGERVFVDPQGRERVFHGTNVVVKGAPWLPRLDHFDPLTSLVQRDFDFLLDAGINLIRLGVMWPGAEPARGEYNETYFSSVREIVKTAGSRGVYVLLDMHQDLLSEHFCGEGIPSWAVEPLKRHWERFPVPLWARPVEPGADGFPTRQDCAEIFSENPFSHGWATGQGTIAAGHAYDSLFLNVNNMTEAWGAFWAKTASAVKGLDNVLGFELMNEPFAGDPFTHPLLLEPGRADRERLQPAYDAVVRHIRAVDDATLVFFAGVTWDNVHPAGFTAAPGGAQDRANRSVLSYHYYVPPQGRDFEAYLRTRRQDATRLGTGLMMTESCCEQLHDLAVPALGAAGHSWIHWEWKDWCREDLDDASRASSSQGAAWGACKTGFGAGPWSEVPYLPAVAGTLGGTAWNASTGVFTATFRPDPSLAGGTEALVSPVSFPAGYDVAVEPAVLAVERRPEAARVLLTPLANASASQVVTVTITRRSPGAAKAAEVLVV
ncbi:unnamed protein product, partial [Prorocentrum cordatum]